MIQKLEKIYFEQTNSTPTDTLTGLYNYGFFNSFLKEALPLYRKKHMPVSLAVVDIDHFSGINKRLGHTDGDRVLKMAAEKIKETIRDGDVAARHTGDIFAVFLSEADRETANLAAERLRKAITQTEEDGITASIGVVSIDSEEFEPSSLFDCALSALEQAKIRGKNRIQSYNKKEQKDNKSIARVLIVDDDEMNSKLLNAMISPLGYETVFAEDGETALAFVNKIDFDLILLDIMMPGIDGFEVCRKLKESETTRHIPVILITALDDKDAKVRGIEAGADDFLTKPANREELLARTQSLIKVRQLNKNYTSMENVLFSLANAVEAKDSYTQGHTERVARLAENLGTRMNLPEDDLAALRLGGILHDVGKIGVSGQILNKPGPLEENEWDEMKSHTELGYHICLPLTKTLGKALDIVRHHHEKLDGSSYPDGLSGAEITMGARIMGVVDIFDALITDRPYRKAMTTDSAFEILDTDVQNGKLDGNVVEMLKKLVISGPEKQRRKGDSADTEMKTIFVVEDDPLNLKLIRTLLELQNFRIKSETSAEQIIPLSKKYRPELIIMDIQLPGIDGLEATRMLKKVPELSHIPVIAVSAHAMQKDIDEAKAAGCEAYITKPLNTRTFAQSIAEYLR